MSDLKVRPPKYLTQRAAEPKATVHKNLRPIRDLRKGLRYKAGPSTSLRTSVSYRSRRGGFAAPSAGGGLHGFAEFAHAGGNSSL